MGVHDAAARVGGLLHTAWDGGRDGREGSCWCDPQGVKSLPLRSWKALNCRNITEFISGLASWFIWAVMMHLYWVKYLKAETGASNYKENDLLI